MPEARKPQSVHQQLRLKSRKGFLSRRLSRTNQGKGRSASCQAPAHEGGTSHPALMVPAHAPRGAPHTATVGTGLHRQRVPGPCQPARELASHAAACQEHCSPSSLRREGGAPIQSVTLSPSPQARSSPAGRREAAIPTGGGREQSRNPSARPSPSQPPQAAPPAASPEPLATVRPAAITERARAHARAPRPCRAGCALGPLQAWVRHSPRGTLAVTLSSERNHMARSRSKGQLREALE